MASRRSVLVGVVGVLTVAAGAATVARQVPALRERFQRWLPDSPEAAARRLPPWPPDPGPGAPPVPPLVVPDPPPAPREIGAGLSTVEDLAFTADGRFVVTAGYGDYSIRLWDVARGEELDAFRTGRRTSSLAVGPDGLVWAADVYGNLRTVPIHPSGRFGWSRLRALEGTLGREIALSPGGGQVASAVVESYAPEAGASELFVLGSHDGRVLARVSLKEALRRPAFSSSGRWLAAGSTGNTFTVWDTRTGRAWIQTVPKVEPRSEVGSVAFSPDERLLATGHMDSSITIWDVPRRRQLHNFYVPQSSAWDVAWSPDGSVLATALQNGTVVLWDGATAGRRGVLAGHRRNVREIAFSPDGRRLASWGEDERLLVWDLAPGSVPPSPPAAVAAPSLPEPADVLRLVAQLEKAPGLAEDDRRRLREGVGGFGGMDPAERAAFAASLLALAAATEIGSALAESFRGSGEETLEIQEWRLAGVPEAAPVVAGLDVVRRRDVSRLGDVFARPALDRLSTRPREDIEASLDRLWRQALGGSTAGSLHVAYRGDDGRGVLEISFPTRGLPHRGIDGSVDVLDVPVMAEDGRWKIAAAP